MSQVKRRAFRPRAEEIEDRVLTTAGITSHVAPPHGILAETLHASHHKATSWVVPPVIGPGLDGGLVRLALPGNYLDYGVVTIWNNTLYPATIGVGANTYNHGTIYAFTLQPGTNKSFYAPRIGHALPTFAVSFGPGAPLIPLPQDNLVFESTGYVPSGTAGYPYAINLGPHGYQLSYI